MDRSSTLRTPMCKPRGRVLGSESARSSSSDRCRLHSSSVSGSAILRGWDRQPLLRMRRDDVRRARAACTPLMHGRESERRIRYVVPTIVTRDSWRWIDGLMVFRPSPSQTSCTYGRKWTPRDPDLYQNRGPASRGPDYDTPYYNDTQPRYRVVPTKTSHHYNDTPLL